MHKSKNILNLAGLLVICNILLSFICFVFLLNDKFSAQYKLSQYCNYRVTFLNGNVYLIFGLSFAQLIFIFFCLCSLKSEKMYFFTFSTVSALLYITIGVISFAFCYINNIPRSYLNCSFNSSINEDLTKTYENRKAAIVIKYIIGSFCFICLIIHCCSIYFYLNRNENNEVKSNQLIGEFTIDNNHLTLEELNSKDSAKNKAEFDNINHVDESLYK